MNTANDDILHSESFLPEVLPLPPPITGYGDDAAPSFKSKVPEYTYYDQVWVYSKLEAFKSGISKEDFAVILTLQRLDMNIALENPEPIRLSFQNQVITSENDDSADSVKLDSDKSDSDSPSAPKGEKVTRQFLPNRVSSKARIA